MAKLSYQVVKVDVYADSTRFAAPPSNVFWTDFVPVGRRVRAVELIAITPGLAVLWFIGQGNHDASAAIPVFPGKLFGDSEPDARQWYNDGIGYGIASANPVLAIVPGQSFTVAVYQ